MRRAHAHPRAQINHRRPRRPCAFVVRRTGSTELRHDVESACSRTNAIDTSGPLEMLHLEDGWVVVGEGQFVPVDGPEEAAALIQEFA